MFSVVLVTLRIVPHVSVDSVPLYYATHFSNYEEGCRVFDPEQDKY